MSATEPNFTTALKKIGVCLFGLCGCAFMMLVIIVPIFYLAKHETLQTQTKNFETFHTNFFTLPEVQELYNLSAINSTWFDLRFLSTAYEWERIGSDSLPESFEELTMNLLLKSVKKQHALESELENQKQYVQFLALVVAFMIVIVGFLWKRTSGSYK